MSQSFSRLLGISLLCLSLVMASQAERARSGDDLLRAKQLVAQALEAESLGNTGERQKLLEQAVSLAPDDAPARWHSGYVERDGQWMTIKEAQEKAANDDRLNQYWQQANAATLNVKDQMRLARWCEKQGLEQLASMHWYRVLLKQPRNREAAEQLGLEEYKGQFLSPDQIVAMKAYEKASEHWTPKLKSWKKALRGKPENRDAALGELRRVEDVAAVPFLINEFADDPELAKEVVAILGGMSPFETYGWLCVFAVEHADKEVRASARQQLVSQLGREPRIRQGLLPKLLGQLHVPAEFNYYVSTLQMISYTIDTYHPGTNLQTSVMVGRPYREEITYNSRSQSLRPFVRFLPRPAVFAQLATAEQAVRSQNEIVRSRNQRLFSTLRSVTEQNLPDDPQRWWNWWLQENERYMDVNQPTLYKDLISSRPRDIRIRIYSLSSLSCFVAGTPIWTETGPKPIERVRVGERVLSQDSESGELCYQFVCKTTLRPPSKTLRLRIGHDEIWSTLGHLFWVSGKGWKMAKQLEVGDLIHSVDGAYPVTAIEKGPTVEAHNLVVDQFNTYFVGERPLLVHDNMPHRLTPTIVPGLVDDAVSEDVSGDKRE